jgi:hypothetical protein
MTCPHCGKDDTWIIMTVYHCNVCNRAFSEMEGKQALIIKRLQEVIRELNREKRKAS